MAALNPLHSAKRIVVKIGSALLVDPTTRGLRFDWLKSLAQDVQSLRQQGKDVILVSSGSIALGRSVLDLGQGALTLEQSQAAAAVGQIRLARAYEEVLSPYDITTAQVLLTLDDSEVRRRYLNSRATVATLLSYGVVPIVNENDTVATDEIRFGDNDRLAAQVAVMASADALVLLSDVDGFYSGNPKESQNVKRFDVIDNITPELEKMAGGAGTAGAKGGMKTKIMAAKVAMSAGCAMCIAEGSALNPLQSILDNATCTWFSAKTDPMSARKTWISGMKPKGEITVDLGAITALKSGKSLLSAGVVRVSGDFERGDPVVLVSELGHEIAKGIARYDVSEAAQIAGHKSSDIKGILGYIGRAALVHRDDMVL